MTQISTILWWIGGGCLTAIIIIFAILYFRGTFRDRVEYKVKNVPSPQDARFPLALASLSNSVITSGHSTNFWLESEQINAARLAAIRSAKHTIHFETFFMTPGRRANDFAAAIAEKAQSGVNVQVIVDKYGVKTLPQRYWKRLKAAGIEVGFFNDLNWRSPIDYFARSHRKLLIVDGEFALIGGSGISDYWDGKDNISGTHPWYDFETRLEGEVVAVLSGMFMQHWTYVHGTADLSTTIDRTGISSDPTILVTAGDDPSYRSASVKALFQVSIHAARQRLWIASPYFLADTNIRTALVDAKKRGVDVKILTNGIRSDKRFVYFASCEQYRDLLMAGVEIYEYQPSMMHAKALLLDDRWISTGSANFDPRSFFHNDELDISTSEIRLVKRIEQLLREGFAKSKQVSFSEWQKRPLWQRALAKIVLFFESQL